METQGDALHDLCITPEDQQAVGSTSASPRRIASRTLHGVLALGLRQITAQGLNVLGAILLARLLTPAQFGIYAIIVFVRTFLVAFGDAGLGASLIREPREPREDEYRAVFTLQQTLVAVIFLAFWAASPAVTRAYHLGGQDVWLFRLVALSLLCSSFQVIPAIRMERALDFRKLALVEVAMAVVFNVTAVGLAWKGWGEMSFGIALLARSLAGAILAHIACPWHIRWSAAWGIVRPHLRFGLPYQGVAFISLLKDSVAPIYIGLLLGAAQMGYVNWANMVAVYPILIIGALQRVYMPAFSRMQNHPQSLGGFVERAILATNAVVAPSAVLILVLAGPITRVIFGEKWLVALPLLYLFWSANLFVPTFTPLLSLLNALGRSQTTFLFALVWMIGTWVIGVPLIWLWGALGYAVATLFINVSNVLLYRFVRSYVQFRILPAIGPIWVWAAALGFAAYGLAKWHSPTSLAGLAVVAIGYLAAYFGGLLARYFKEARMLWAMVFDNA